MLDKQTQEIKDRILQLYPKLRELYGDLVATTAREDELMVSWDKGDIWLRWLGSNPVDFYTWQNPKDVVEVSLRLPKLLDALDKVKAEKTAEEQRRAGDLFAAHSALAVVAERLRMPGTPQHPTEFEDDHIAL